MHPAYFETRFYTPEPVAHWPDHFVILTAEATTGETWTPERCAAADAELHCRLSARGGWLVRVTGYSPTTGHSEAGWAVDLDPLTACELGREFLQDALYIVERGELFICQCDRPDQPVRVSSFRERLDREPAAPRAAPQRGPPTE